MLKIGSYIKSITRHFWPPKKSPLEQTTAREHLPLRNISPPTLNPYQAPKEFQNSACEYSKEYQTTLQMFKKIAACSLIGYIPLAISWAIELDYHDQVGFILAPLVLGTTLAPFFATQYSRVEHTAQKLVNLFRKSELIFNAKEKITRIQTFGLLPIILTAYLSAERFIDLINNPEPIQGFSPGINDHIQTSIHNADISTASLDILLWLSMTLIPVLEAKIKQRSS